MAGGGQDRHMEASQQLTSLRLRHVTCIYRIQKKEKRQSGQVLSYPSPNQLVSLYRAPGGQGLLCTLDPIFTQFPFLLTIKRNSLGMDSTKAYMFTTF